MIITIDGPAGSGKSSTAREVARRLGYRHLDSGAFYRALTVAALRAGIPPDRWPELSGRQLDDLGVHARGGGPGYRLFAGEEDVTEAIRTPEVNAHVSEMARVPAVRGWLLESLRDAGRSGDLVTDGRDMGTVVFPDADLKVFLVARADVRARRRLLEQGLPIDDPSIMAEEQERLLGRDRKDATRDVAPLRPAPDAIEVDTSDLTIEQQVRHIVELARKRLPDGDSV